MKIRGTVTSKKEITDTDWKGTQATSKSAARSPATRESHILAGWGHRAQQNQQHSHQQQENHTYLLDGDTEHNKISSTVTSNKGITHTCWMRTQCTTKSAAQSPVTKESHIQAGREHRAQQNQEHSHQQQGNHTYLLDGNTEHDKISSTITSNKGITHTAWEGTQSTTKSAVQSPATKESHILAGQGQHRAQQISSTVTSNKGITRTSWKGTQSTTKSAAQSPATESHILAG
jgi:hypothetical protein